MNRTPKPLDILLHQKSRELEIRFDDGVSFRYSCELLRVYSPSAEVRGHWGQNARLEVGKERVNILDIRPVGSYAVKLVFDDGHDSGLYDWGYLYDLGRKKSLYWAQYMERLLAAGHRRDEAAAVTDTDPGQAAANTAPSVD